MECNSFLSFNVSVHWKRQTLICEELIFYHKNFCRKHLLLRVHYKESIHKNHSFHVDHGQWRRFAMCCCCCDNTEKKKLRVWFQRVWQHWSHGTPEVLIALPNLSITVINTFEGLVLLVGDSCDLIKLKYF